MTAYVDLQINLAAPTQAMNAAAKRALAYASHALSIESTRPLGGVALPSTVFGFTIDPVADDPDLSRQAYESWVLAAVFRDLIETTGDVLERAREILVACELARERVIGSMGDLDTALADGATAFHEAGLPQKFTLLLNRFGFEVPEQYGEHLLSLNRARNCLVHRRGVVGRRDLHGEESLVLSWNRLELVAMNGDECRPIELGAVLNGPTDVGVRLVGASKKFALGQRVLLSTNELSEICQTFIFAGAQLHMAFIRIATAAGVKMAEIPSNLGDGV